VIDLKTTGEVKLSCSHSFHFSCISTWFSKQEKGSCPCCRKEMGDKEDFAANAPIGEDDDDDDDDDEDEDEDEDTVTFNRSELNALIVKKFGCHHHIGEEQWAAMMDAYVEINPDYRGERRIQFNSSDIDMFFAAHCWKNITASDWYELLAADETPVTGAFESARLDFTTPLQLPSVPLPSSLKVSWMLMEDGSWTRSVMNPEDEPMAAILSPALTAAAAAASATEAATKVQAVWRGFSSRVRQVLPRLRVTSVWM
jgi:hypothetical protein